MVEVKLEKRYPSHQNAVELFGDRWLTKIEDLYPGLSSGPARYLLYDYRPVHAADHLGFVPRSLHGMKVLELGPMEGHHTYHLARLGAESVLAIEANSEAYLRCLVMKEILQPANCRFLLGDGLVYLQQNESRYDLIFCSGFLYHMENPFTLIQAMAARTDRIFLSTHYFDPEDPKGPAVKPRAVVCDGLDLTFYEHAYEVDVATQAFWGGNNPVAAWLTREDIKRCFQHFGFVLTIHEDDRDIPSGHHLMGTAIRT